MRQSRYIWILGITFVCLLGVTTWKTPQTVMVAMVQPQHADTPRDAIQSFWGYLDSRQLDLVDRLVLIEDMNPVGQQEVEVWKDRVQRNPLIGLKKLDFVDSADSQSVMVKVNWSSSLEEEITETYVMEIRETSEGWKIIDMKCVHPQSLAGNKQ